MLEIVLLLVFYFLHFFDASDLKPINFPFLLFLVRHLHLLRCLSEFHHSNFSAFHTVTSNFTTQSLDNVGRLASTEQQLRQIRFLIRRINVFEDFDCKWDLTLGGKLNIHYFSLFLSNLLCIGLVLDWRTGKVKNYFNNLAEKKFEILYDRWGLNINPPSAWKRRWSRWSCWARAGRRCVCKSVAECQQSLFSTRKRRQENWLAWRW